MLIQNITFNKSNSAYNFNKYDNMFLLKEDLVLNAGLIRINLSGNRLDHIKRRNKKIEKLNVKNFLKIIVTKPKKQGLKSNIFIHKQIDMS